MLDQAVTRAQAEPAALRLNVLREYVQHYVLRCLALEGVFDRWAFLGGTALRVLFRLPRFSEDLDFAATGEAEVGFDEVVARVAERLRDAGYGVAPSRMRLEKTVQSGFLKFEGLPFQAGATRDRRLSLSIKLEVDQRPPDGAGIERSLVTTFVPVALSHYDLPSLFAGKLHAALVRPYPKGRDWYDVVWYLTRPSPVVPNQTFLRNALEQTGAPPLVEMVGWRERLLARFDELPWAAVLDDVRPFLERVDDLPMLERDLVRKLIAGGAGV